MNNENQNPNIPEEEVGESIAAKRLKHFGAPSDQLPEPEFEPDNRTPFRRKLDNFWFHYKWHTISALCVILMLAIMIPQCLFRPTYDAYILYAGPMMDCSGGETVQGVQNSLVGLGMSDYNGDGERNVMYRPIFLLSQQQLDEMEEKDKNITLNTFLNENRNLFSNELAVGECYICLLDPSIFRDLRDDGWIVNMNEILSESEIPENSHGDYGVTLGSLDFGKSFAGFKNMPKDTVLCFRYMTVTADMAGKEQASEKRQAAIDLFRRMLTFSAEMG